MTKVRTINNNSTAGIERIVDYFNANHVAYDRAGVESGINGAIFNENNSIIGAGTLIFPLGYDDRLDISNIHTNDVEDELKLIRWSEKYAHMLGRTTLYIVSNSEVLNSRLRDRYSFSINGSGNSFTKELSTRI